MTLAISKESAEANPVAEAASRRPAPLGTRPAELAQIVIAVGVVIALLRFAQPFCVPLLIGILTSCTCGPLVTALQRF